MLIQTDNYKPTMTEKDFIMWLEGYLDGVDEGGLDQSELDKLRSKLNLVTSTEIVMLNQFHDLNHLPSC